MQTGQERTCAQVDRTYVGSKSGTSFWLILCLSSRYLEREAGADQRTADKRRVGLLERVGETRGATTLVLDKVISENVYRRSAHLTRLRKAAVGPALPGSCI
jgi:hypothetical protein